MRHVLTLMVMLAAVLVGCGPRDLQYCSSGASYLPDGSYVCVNKIGPTKANE